MKQSLDQAHLHTHLMYMDCWHELPQTLLGCSSAETVLSLDSFFTFQVDS